MFQHNEKTTLTSLQDLRVLLIGCGRMGSALAHGWLAGGIKPENLWILEPKMRAGTADMDSRVVFVDKAAVLDACTFDVVVLAVKPQAVREVAQDARVLFQGTATGLSIVAGYTCADLVDTFRTQTSWIRAMPNLPAQIRRGVSVLYAPRQVSACAREHCRSLLTAVGTTMWVEDERLMHAITAVSGSGPAYYFFLVESLAQAAERVGIPAREAYDLAKETLCGAAALAHSSDKTASVLRREVTSPGGTTEAAMRILHKEMPELMTRAVVAAQKRARQLA